MSKEAAMQGYLDAMKDVYKNIFFFILNNKTDQILLNRELIFGLTRF